MTETVKQVIDILLIEDNPGDIRLAREAFQSDPVTMNLRVATDGEEAMTTLKDASIGRPNLVILDLNLPKKDGREVLAEIKSNPALRHIPVVVLTTSKAEEDISKAYDLQANCVVAKGSDWEQSCAVVRSIEEFWLKTARLPLPA